MSDIENILKLVLLFKQLELIYSACQIIRILSQVIYLFVCGLFNDAATLGIVWSPA
jgi:hypothetical protein